MLVTETKDIFDFEGDAIVNPVTCDGIIDTGIAQEIKHRAPSNFTTYAKLCKAPAAVRPGMLYLNPTKELGLYIRTIINLPIMCRLNDLTDPAWIEAGLRSMVGIVRVTSLHTVAMPLLGIGRGGLTDEQSYKLMRDTLTKLGATADADRVYAIYIRDFWQ